MQIQILSATPKQLHAKTPGKTYSALELAFKNLTFQGKVEGKNLVAFGTGKAAYDTLLNAKPGEIYEVSIVKENGFNQWTSATKSDGGDTSTGTSSPAATAYAPNSAYPPKAPGTQTTTSPKSTYETPEERAKKQIYIVRQSSISNAIDLLSVGQKSPPDVDKILEAASRFESFVFGDSTKPASEVAGVFFPQKVDPATAFDDLDDIPL